MGDRHTRWNPGPAAATGIRSLRRCRPLPLVLLLALLLGCEGGGAASAGSAAPAVRTAPAALREHPVGWSTLDLQDERRNRPLALQLWYPAASGSVEQDQRHDRIFQGRAAAQAPIADGPLRPLVLLSHGTGGSPGNHAWLAERLARRGYLVAAVAHHQDHYGDAEPEGALRVWERPQDLSAVLTLLQRDPHWGARLDTRRIGAAGFSSGGYTVLALAGARYRPRQMQRYCGGPEAGADCGLVDRERHDQTDYAGAAQSYRDARVRAVLALAPALGPGMDLESLRAIQTPVQIIATRDDEILPFAQHALHYAETIPQAELLALPAGGHFLFMAECNRIGVLVTWFHRFDLCGRRAGVERARVHAQIAETALAFFEAALKDPQR